jgi:uncharacterized protein YqhQ
MVKEKTDKQYHGQKKRQTNNTMVKGKEKKRQTSNTMVLSVCLFFSFLLTMVLFVCPFFSFDHGIVCLSFLLTMVKQYHGQKKRKEKTDK